MAALQEILPMESLQQPQELTVRVMGFIPLVPAEKRITEFMLMVPVG
jgi:hypothetical protein